MTNYLEEELKLNYLDLCKFLQNKYGEPRGDYFLTESCKSKNNKITRGKEGLFLHHIKENESIMLCNTDFAIKHPFEYQKSYNLVYCNYLEHLLLHIKIVDEYLNEESIAKNGCAVGIGGIVNFIVPEINDYFNGYEYKREWQVESLKKIQYKDFKELKLLALQLIPDKKYLPVLRGRQGRMTNIDTWMHNLIWKPHSIPQLEEQSNYSSSNKIKNKKKK